MVALIRRLHTALVRSDVRACERREVAKAAVSRASALRRESIRCMLGGRPHDIKANIFAAQALEAFAADLVGDK
jgi:hypothetical protein